MNDDRYLEDFATIAVYFIVTVVFGLAALAGVIWWVWEV